MSERQKSVVLLSGGLDSCTVAAIAANDSDLYFLHANYGQRTETREHLAALNIARHYNGTWMEIDLPLFAQIKGSVLTDQSRTEEMGDLNRVGIPATYVPFRNANLLAAGVSWAETIGATQVYLGVVQEDSSGYPDCRENFIAAFQQAIDAGTSCDHPIRIVAPLLHLSKGEIIKKGSELHAPYHLSWSCYYAEDEACGTCDSCLLRLRGFTQAGIEDPVQYQTTGR